MLDLVLFISMLSGAKYVADSNERDRARTRRQGAKGRAAGARYDRNQAAIWRERWQRERQAHGKTKGERKHAGAAARERVQRHFSLAVMLSGYAGHYVALLNRKLREEWAAPVLREGTAEP